MYKNMIYNFNTRSSDIILYKNYNNIPLQLIEATVNALKNEGGLPEIINGLNHFIEALNEYLKLVNNEEELNMETARILLYESVRLINGEFVRATLSYNNLPIFNDISIRMEEDQLEEFITYNGACFAKVKFI
jgi:hypothetical protein